MTQEVKTEKVTVIDGQNLILGRLGSLVAKRLLMGETIKIVNCKDIAILGRKKYLADKYKAKLSNKVVKQGPYYSRSPADLVRRAFRNMLPYKNERGIEAYKRLKCYNSVPSTLKASEKVVIKEAQMDEDSVFYYTKVEEISKVLGYNK